jgi:hypothetical protein
MSFENENFSLDNYKEKGNQKQKRDEETRSIVYGNPIRNKYGQFRCYCAAVSNKGTFFSYKLEKFQNKLRLLLITSSKIANLENTHSTFMLIG